MSDNNAGTIQGVAIQVSRFFAPIARELANGQFVELFAELGLNFPPGLESDPTFTTAAASTFQTVSALPGLVQGVIDAADGGNVLDALNNLTTGIAQAFTAVQSLVSTLGTVGGSLPGMNAGDVATFVQNLPSSLFNWSAVTYVEDTLPILAAILDLFGVIERTEQQVGSTDPVHPQFTQKVLHLDKLPRALFSPPGALQDLYGFGNASFDGQALFTRIASILSSVGIPAVFDTAANPPALDVVFAELTKDATSSPPGVAVTFKTQLSTTAQQTVGALTVAETFDLSPVGATLIVRPDLSLSLSAPASSTATGDLTLTVTLAEPSSPIVLIGQPSGSRLEVHAVSASAGATLTWDPASATAKGTLAASASASGVHLFVQPSSDDGFLSSIIPGNGVDSTFDVGLEVDSSGVRFNGSASIQIVLPVHLDLGVVKIDALRLGVGLSGQGVTIPLGADISATLGPVDAVVQGLGVQAEIGFPGSGGNAGPVQVGIDLLPPTGIGITVDAGPVSGGGFLSVGANEYAGALELSIYSIAVKAFGLIDTKLPDGSKGYSFVVVISAEFTPIQLGFGFTLLGVGGLVGINRTIDEKALQSGVQSGSIANLLFPANPVKDAPAIINDLGRFFPAASGHYLFGPMAKLGWGTPTLIRGQLGIILELPGPRLSLLGIVNVALPTASAAIISLNMAIGGLLDFPGKLFWLEATLYDSHVVGFNISGGMAFRITWGDNPNFALAVGGFNPAYEPPAGFPSLQRCAVDFGINGNPSLTCQSYFAVTSNTAQAGASIDLRASGFGIDLSGHLGFDALFIFSPFSFEVDFNASVHVDFEGVGFGLGMHGSISGPTPWRVQAQVCVSILFWDACLPVDITFGTSKRVTLPQLDPWVGQSDPANASNNVIGLSEAISNPNNWSGGFPTGAFPVVTLTASATADKQPIDPVGQATLHQKVLPLNYQLSKFGIYQPKTNTKFTLQSVTVGSASPSFTVNQDFFAPALFRDMKGDEKLSTPSYEKHDSGFTVAPDNVVPGDINPKKVTYVTDVIDPKNNESTVAPFDLPLRFLQALLAKGASALGGIRRSGAQRFVDVTAPVKVQLSEEAFVVADGCTLVQNFGIASAPAARSTTQATLDDHVAATPSDAGQFRVVPAYLVRQAA